MAVPRWLALSPPFQKIACDRYDNTSNFTIPYKTLVRSVTTMAKGLRASRVKKNNSALRKKVFSPAENARNERLNAKLQALIAQPKPPREEMDVEDGMSHSNPAGNAVELVTNIHFTEPASTDAKASGAAAEGTPSLSIPIPQSVFTVNPNDQLPTPPATPSTDSSTPATPILDRAGQQQLAKEQLFFHLLGASSEIIGFDPNGDLRLAFNSSHTSEG